MEAALRGNDPAVEADFELSASTLFRAGVLRQFFFIRAANLIGCPDINPFED
jgi:hypothetical protein